MDWSFRKLSSNQIEKQVFALRKFKVPAKGWIKTIREILGMNTRQLGSRVGVSSERIIKIESDEIEKKLTMATLEKLANGMNCKFIYAFVPNEELCKTIENCARSKVNSQVNRISHTMRLEDQELESQEIAEQIDILTEEMLKKNIKKIWDK